MSNVNNTIAGAGFIGGGGLAVVNSGTINANTVSTLFLNANTINAGKLEATASGGTLILGANISNTSTGTILASGSGAQVDFHNATILGGKLQTSGAGAVIETQNGTTDLLSGCTIAAASLLEVTSNATLKLSGGTIGVGAVVEPLTGGTVSVAGTVHNSGTLFASGSNSVVLITSGAVVTGGVAEIGDGTVFVAASSSENVAFLANGSGGLVLNGLGNAYAGRVSGFGFGSSAHSDHDQFIDFDAVNFTGATFTYTSANPSNTSGTLTVINGGNSASVLLVGNYSAGNFTQRQRRRWPHQDHGSRRGTAKRRSWAPDKLHGRELRQQRACTAAPWSPRRRRPPIRRCWRIPTCDDARAGPGYANPQSRRLTSVRYS